MEDIAFWFTGLMILGLIWERPFKKPPDATRKLGKRYVQTKQKVSEEKF